MSHKATNKKRAKMRPQPSLPEATTNSPQKIDLRRVVLGRLDARTEAPADLCVIGGLLPADRHGNGEL
jgi:hypothetical protein